MHAEARKPGQEIFTGHSMGAEVLCLYLRSNPDIDPAENVFALTRNPERKYGGVIALSPSVRPSWAKPAYGGIGIPDDTSFRVFDLAHQYDHFADYPSIRVKAAVDNAEDKLATGIHVDYSTVRFGDPRNVGFVEGNGTYYLAPTYPMPAARRFWWGPKREALRGRFRVFRGAEQHTTTDRTRTPCEEP